MNQSCDFTGEIIVVILGAIIALIVQGWFNRRKELKDRIKDIVSDIKELQTFAIDYWMNELSNDKCLILETKIKSKLSTIRLQSLQLEKNYFSYRPSISREYNNLKKSITGGQFESRPKPVIVGNIEIIESNSHELEIGIRNSQNFF